MKFNWNYGLLLIAFLIRAVNCGHSLQYYHTVVSSPGHGLPQYISVGYVDGIQITRYSSDTGRTRPVAPWMKKVEDPEYWKEQTQNGKHAEAVNKLNVKIAMYRFNQTGGFHSYQMIYGCELRDDGSTRGYWQFGYDGKDFLALDTERWVYYPITDQAQVSAQKWNNPDVQAVERAKDYLKNECIDWLKKYLEYGKDELERRVRPEVKVFSRRSDGVTKLHCQVYGFYPRDVDVNWKKNGMDIPSDEAEQILPNTDGTFQIRVTVAVTPEDGASYACHVYHSSLNEPLIVTWDPKTDDKKYLQRVTFSVSVVTVIILVLTAAVVLFIRWKRKCSGNKKYIHDSYKNNEKSLSLSDAKHVSHVKSTWDAEHASHVKSTWDAEHVSHVKSTWDAEHVSHVKSMWDAKHVSLIESSRYAEHDTESLWDAKDDTESLWDAEDDTESLWDAEHVSHRKRRWSFDNRDDWREKQEEISLQNYRLVTEDGYAVTLSCPQTMNQRLSFSVNTDCRLPNFDRSEGTLGM